MGACFAQKGFERGIKEIYEATCIYFSASFTSCGNQVLPAFREAILWPRAFVALCSDLRFDKKEEQNPEPVHND